MPSWPEANWFYQLVNGLSDNDLEDIVTQCDRTDNTVEARFAYIMLILMKRMAKKILNERGN